MQRGIDNAAQSDSNELGRLNAAFNLSLRGLHLVDRNDPICDMVARKVIEIGTNGVSDPKEIANRVTRQLGPKA
jgi:hypothetical protein